MQPHRRKDWLQPFSWSLIDQPPHCLHRWRQISEVSDSTKMRKWKWLLVNGCDCKRLIPKWEEFLNLCQDLTNASICLGRTLKNDTLCNKWAIFKVYRLIIFFWHKEPYSLKAFVRHAHTAWPHEREHPPWGFRFVGTILADASLWWAANGRWQVLPTIPLQCRYQRTGTDLYATDPHRQPVSTDRASSTALTLS